MDGKIVLFTVGVIAVLCAFASPAQSADLYKVIVSDFNDAEVLKAVEVEPVLRVREGYLVLADAPAVERLNRSGLKIELIESNLTVEQLAIDARQDKKNVDKYPLVYEEDRLRVYRADARHLVTTGDKIELMPVRNEQIRITFPTLKHIDETALLSGVNMDSLLNLINQDSLESYLYRLEAFYRRLAGTDSNYAARDWLESKFYELGYDSVVIDSFEGAQLWDYYPVPCYNVYAVKPGSRFPDRQVVVGAHFDAVPDCPGADDNGSGTAAVLELARVLRDIETEMTFVFIAFDSEESWMWGSYHYVENALLHNDDIVYMMNLDMIGHYNNDHYANIYHGPEKGYSELWCRLAERYVNITGFLGGSTASDHLPFQDAGYDVSFVQEGNFSTEYHQPTDSTTYINFEYMTRMVKASLATVYTTNRSLAPVTTTDVFDVGDGQAIQVHWQSGDMTDVDFYWLHYNTVPETQPESLMVSLDSTRYIVSGLTEGQKYRFYLLAGSSEGRISIIYNAIEGTPYLQPLLPENQQAKPLMNGIYLFWSANNRELDFDHYEIIRDRVRLPDIVYDTVFSDLDPSLGNDFHEYIIVAVDADGYISDTAGFEPVVMRAATLNPYKILAINRTSYLFAISEAARSGDFLREALAGYQYDYLSDSAYIKKNDNIDLLSLIDYGTIVIAAESGAGYDDIGQLPQAGGILEDIGYYLSLGGKAVIFGRWGNITTVSPYLETVFYSPDTTYQAAYVDYFHIDSRTVPQSFTDPGTLTIFSDLIGGHSAMTGYPDLTWDSLAAADHSEPFNISGIPCPSIPQLNSPMPEIIYTYDSQNDSIYTEGKTVGWRYLGGEYEYVFFDIPLSFIERVSAVAALRQALTDLGLEVSEDADGDGIPDVADNCVSVYNPDQLDFDLDGMGDLCDPDDDNDEIADETDNCPFTFNPDQDDIDFDGYGDACDRCPGFDDQYDEDNDSIPDGCDNCPQVANANQNNIDGDDFGDVCDNCRYVVNNDQVNADGDGYGDACDNCPELSSDNQADSDNDGLGNVCDNCPYVYNPGQEDVNQDQVGDACCCEGFTGNADCSPLDEPDISDITTLIDHLYLSHKPLCCPGEADVDKSGGEPDISDITALIDHLYLSHKPLPPCP